MSYHCRDIFTTTNATSGGFRPSEPPQLLIKFDLYFETEFQDYVETGDDSVPVAFLGSSVPFPGRRSATVDAAAPAEVVEAALAAAAGDLLAAAAADLDELLDRACEEVNRELPAPESLRRRHETLVVRLDVTSRHHHVYPAAAAAAALAALEEGCCICLEEFGGGGGGGAVRMPCKHVFHGRCIRKWLRKRPSCPLCRYEMPTE